MFYCNGLVVPKHVLVLTNDVFFIIFLKRGSFMKRLVEKLIFFVHFYSLSALEVLRRPKAFKLFKSSLIALKDKSNDALLIARLTTDY